MYMNVKLIWFLKDYFSFDLISIVFRKKNQVTIREREREMKREVYKLGHLWTGDEDGAYDVHWQGTALMSGMDPRGLESPESKHRPIM